MPEKRETQKDLTVLYTDMHLGAPGYLLFLLHLPPTSDSPSSFLQNSFSCLLCLLFRVPQSLTRAVSVTLGWELTIRTWYARQWVDGWILFLHLTESVSYQ